MGFFAYSDWISRAPESPILRLLVVVQRREPTRLVWVPTHLPLDYRSLRQAWEHLGLYVAGGDHEEQVQTAWEASMRICLPLLLYLASQDPDVRHRRDQERRPERRAPQRQEGAPNWWEVVYRVGAALRSHTGPGADATIRSAVGSGRTSAPHVRRAHYHLYWTGRGRQEPRIRWLHPILVGDRQGHELPPTIRTVEAPS